MDNPGPKPLVLLYIVDAGGGHRAAANALLAAAATRERPFRLEVASIQDVLASVDWPRRLTGVSLEETYNGAVRRGWTWGLVPILRTMQWVVRRAHGKLVSLFCVHLEARRPAIVVSLAPNFNAPLRDAVKRSFPGVPFLVMLTDYADFPPHFWMERGLDTVVVGSDEAVEQADRVGLKNGRVVRHSGMPLHPRFYPRVGPDRRQDVRAELQIPEEAFVTLLLFGGKGTPEMAGLARELVLLLPDVHVIAIAGSNPRLAARLEQQALLCPRLHPFGFTDRVADFMAASDLMVTKPGPGTIAEALHQRIPIVTLTNGRTVPQERFNAEYLTRHGLGAVEHRWADLAGRVRALALDPALRVTMRERQSHLPENRATFEMLELLEGLVASPRI